MLKFKLVYDIDRASEINVLMSFIWKLSCTSIRLYGHPSMAKAYYLCCRSRRMEK